VTCALALMLRARNKQVSCVSWRAKWKSENSFAGSVICRSCISTGAQA